MENVRIVILLKKHGFRNEEEVQDVLRRAFYRPKKNFFHKQTKIPKPTTFRLVNALEVAQAILDTQDLNSMIRWANNERK